MRRGSCEMIAVEAAAWWQGGRVEKEVVVAEVAGWSKRGGWAGKGQGDGGRGRYRERERERERALRICTNQTL